MPYEKVIELALELALKIYDDTPKANRVENLERWYRFIDRLEALAGKVPDE